MALFFPGRTKCTLCDRTIESEEDGILSPAFLGSAHALGRYSDSAFHRQCFNEWELHDEFSALFEEYQDVWRQRPTNLSSVSELENWHADAFRKFRG